MKLREMRFEDHAAIGRVLAGNGLRTPTGAQWQYFWRNTPDDGRLSDIPMGWVLDHEADGIVGTFRNVAFEYEWNRRPIRLVVASAWAVDAKHRRASLQLATAYFKQPNVDVLLNTTAVEATSGKAFLAFGAQRVPQPAYTQQWLWVTGYRGFVEGLLRKKGIPAPAALTYPAAAAMWMADATTGRNSSLRARPEQVRMVDAFDERFDRFWERIRTKPDRLQAVRNRATLAWRFALEHPARPPLIVTLDEHGELAGYAVFVRRDDPSRGLRRVEVADLQVVDDDPRRLQMLMRGGLRLAYERGIHVVAMSGQQESKRRALDALKPYRKTASGWPLYYKALAPELRECLRSPNAWDVSPFDGDILWSGVFGAEAG